MTKSRMSYFQNGAHTLARWLLAMAVLATAPSWAGCNISTTGLSFGSYQPLMFVSQRISQNVVSTGTVSIACSNTASPSSYTLALSASTAGTGDRISTRYLANSSGGDNMAFNLYTDPGRTVVWGDGSIGSTFRGTVPAASVGSQTQNVTFYGKIPGGQNTLRAGSFSGSMIITMTYSP